MRPPAAVSGTVPPASEEAVRRRLTTMTTAHQTAASYSAPLVIQDVAYDLAHLDPFTFAVASN